MNRRRLARGEPSGWESTEQNQDGEENIINRLEIYRERKQNIRKICEKYGLGNTRASIQIKTKYKTMEDTFPWPTEKSLMLQPSWHLLYCWIHKVASTSWSEVFFYLRVSIPFSVPPTNVSSVLGEGGTCQSAARSHSVFLTEVTRSVSPVGSLHLPCLHHCPPPAGATSVSLQRQVPVC